MPETMRDKQRKLRRSRLVKKRAEYPARVFQMWKETVRSRVAATRALVDFRGYMGDFHSHSVHSDGTGTVGDLAAMKDLNGLDFLFVTDHGGLTQKRDCVRYENVWWGQEPGNAVSASGYSGA